MEDKMKTKTIYRIENPTTMHGMWYNKAGEFNPIIHELCPDALAKELPMGYDSRHRKDGKAWYSAGKSIENMNQWFNRKDADDLVANGFVLYEFVVTEWQELEMEVLFTRDGVVRQTEIPIETVWK